MFDGILEVMKTLQFDPQRYYVYDDEYVGYERPMHMQIRIIRPLLLDYKCIISNTILVCQNTGNYSFVHCLTLNQAHRNAILSTCELGDDWLLHSFKVVGGASEAN